MKKLLFIVVVVLLFFSCEKGDTYRAGKNIEVSGRSFAAVRDTFTFKTNGFVERRTDFISYSPIHGIYSQSKEVIKISWKSTPNEPDLTFFSYGDFIEGQIGVYREIKE